MTSEVLPSAALRPGALAIYAMVLRRVAQGGDGDLHLLDASGNPLLRLDARRWHAGLSEADESILARCAGPTLDVGCGPGRFTAALARRQLQSLGIDISPAAVQLARAQGARAHVTSVFHDVPDEGAWSHVLLIDGNLGIGGAPVRLLRRCATLMAPTGTILVEVEPPGTQTWAGDVAVTDTARVSAPFAWAAVGHDDLADLAAQADLQIVSSWTKEHRWFACLSR